MKTALVYFYFLVCAGCCYSGNKIEATEKPVVVETIPKTWTDPQSRTLNLLNTTTVDFNLRGQLLIAKYGDVHTGFVTCLDFYRAKTNSTGQNQFVLIKHDYKPGMMVKSIKPAETQDRAALFITRETIPGLAKQREGLRYTWRYEKDYTMNMDLEVGTWTIH